MAIGELLIKMTIFLSLMVVGYAAARTKKVGPDFAKSAAWLTLNVFMTGTIINSAVSNVPDLSGRETFNMMVVLFVTLIIMYVVAALAAKLLGQDRGYEGLSFALMAVVNNMFIGLPVVQELCGSQAVLYVSMSCLPYNILLYTYGVWRIRSGSGKFSFKLRDMFSMPLISTIIAFVLFIFRIPVPKIGKELLSALAAGTMPLSMLVVGTSLGSVNLLDAFKGWRTYVLAAVRLLICPVIVWFVIHNMTDNSMLLTSAIITAASPSGIIVTALSINYGKDAVYTSKNILANTALSMVTIPLIVYILHL